MRRTALVMLALVMAGSTGARGALIAVGQSEFADGATVITFETGTTGTPTVPGMTFLETSLISSPWYRGSAIFTGFFGDQSWSNNVNATTYSELGVDFATPVQAIGGYVGRIWNIRDMHPSSVVIELFDSALVSLGTASISLPTALGSPVFFGFTADRGISRIRISGNNAGFFAVDNFTFGPLQPAAVPEPSALALAVIGLGVLAGGRMARARRAGRRQAETATR
jgi:hypothetical protein